MRVVVLGLCLGCTQASASAGGDDVLARPVVGSVGDGQMGIDRV
jgi:hypothetical protein